MVNFLRIYIWISYTSIRSNLAYLGSIWPNSIYSATLIFLGLQVWQYVYTDKTAQQTIGFTLPQIMWYLAFATAIYDSNPRINYSIDEDVRSGTISIHLIKPLSYLISKIADGFGRQIVLLIPLLALSAIITSLFVGFISITPVGIAMFCTSLCFSFLINLIIVGLIGLGAFWFETTDGILKIYSILTQVLGGIIVPITIFPGWLHSILTFLPFSNMVYGPAKVLITADWYFFIALLARQIIILVILVIIGNLIYQKGLKKVSLNGG